MANKSHWRSAAGPVIVALLGMGMFVTWSLLRFGSIACAMAYLNGQCVQPMEDVIAVGEVPVGREAVAVFQLRNFAGYPITVLGAKATCGCMATDDLPLTVEPRGSANLKLRFKTGMRQAGKLVRHTALLCFDVDTAPVRLGASVEVLPSESDGEGRDLSEIGSSRSCRLGSDPTGRLQQ